MIDENGWSGAGSLHVLLAEDEFLIRLDLAETMRDLGWHVYEVATADEGITMIERGTQIDLLVSDINMPGGDGSDLAAIVRGYCPDARIVLMSGMVKPYAIAEGFYDTFMSKPVVDLAGVLSGLMTPVGKQMMPGENAHVLLVSGDALERTALGEYLRGCGFHVVEAVDGDEATIALEHTLIDIVVSDVRLRHYGSGHSISAFVRKRHPDIKVILVANVDQAVHSAIDLCEEGRADVLPYHPETLIRKIQELCGR